MLFISYSSLDWEAAEAVCAALEVQGLECWMAPRDILPGDDWGSAVLGAIETAVALVLVFSAHASQSSQVKREVSHAVRRGLAVLPIRLDDTTPATAYQLLDAEFAAAADATLPLDARLGILAAAASQAVDTTAPAASIERYHLTPATADWPPRAASHLLRTTLTAAIVIASVRLFLSVVAIVLYSTDDLDIGEARALLVVSLPLHAASVLSLMAVFVVWLSSACGRFLDLRPEDVVRAFLRPPGNLTAPARLVRMLSAAVAVDMPAWMARVWWPLGCAVLLLTILVPILAAADDPGTLLVLSIDAAMTVLWLGMAFLTASIARSIDRVPATPLNRVAARPA